MPKHIVLHLTRVYYWTVNGEFLLDGNGSKVRVTAAAPKLKIEENKWYISYDEGATWEFVASAGVPGGDSIFSSVTVGEDCVTFTLTSGATFMIPLATEFAIVMDQAVEIVPGATASVAYAITGAAEPVVYCIAEGGYGAKISAKTATTGDVVITAPAEKAEGVVIVFAESEGQSIFKSIKLAPAAEKTPIVLVDPVSGTVVFDHTKGIDSVAVTFKWTSESVSPAYTLEISSSSDMADPVVESLDAATTVSLTNRELNSIVCDEFAGEFTTTELYWRINDASGSVLPSEVKSINFTTEFGSFTDVRDNEVYPIAKVGENYWLTENMRAVKYSDGTALEAISGYDFIPYTAGYLGKRAGVYYTYAHAVRGNFDGYWFEVNPGNSDQLQGICPEGWHVANNDDFTAAAQAAAAALGATYDGELFSENYWPEIAPAFRLGSDYPKLDEVCKYTNELGLYFAPSHCFAADSDRQSAPSDYGYEVLIWSSSMVSVWDAYAFQCNQWNNLAFASHYGAHPVGGWAAQMPVRCVKNY